MATAAPSLTARLKTIRRPRGGNLDWPLTTLIGGCVLLVVGAGAIAARVTAFTLDESVYERSAVAYTSNLPSSLIHDPNARGPDRLYSLVLSIAFHLFDAADAIRVDHVLSVALYVSAAIPIYLFARMLLSSRWLAVATALLSIAAPWLGLSSALFTENLAYPLFWWMILATSLSVWRRSATWDLLAIASIGALIVTRVQCGAALVGYVLAYAAMLWWRPERVTRGARRAYEVLAGFVRRCPFTALALLAFVALLIYARASGKWQHDASVLFGSYSSIILDRTVPPNVTEAVAIELIALGLGVGLLPALVSIVWYAKSIASRRLEDRRWVILFASSAVLIVFFALSAVEQLGYLGGATEERYFFYVIPVFWIGTFASLEDRRNVKPSEIFLCALAFAGLFGAISFITPGLSQETAFLAPIESIFPHIYEGMKSALGGLTLEDALAVLTLIVGLLGVFSWKGHRRTTGATLIAAALFQLAVTGYAYAVINGDIEGVSGRTGGSVARLGWVDRHAAGSGVWLIDNISTAAPPMDPAGPGDNQARGTAFWNSSITRWAELPSVGLPPIEWPAESLPNLRNLHANSATGVLSPASDASELHEIVGAIDSPFLQLAGTRIATSPGGVLELERVSQPARAAWLTSGLSTNGQISSAGAIRFSAFDASEKSIAFTFLPPPTQPPGSPSKSALAIRLGTVRRAITLTAGGPARVVRMLAACGAGAAAARGEISVLNALPVNGAEIAATLTGVTITSEAGGAACTAHRRRRG